MREMDGAADIVNSLGGQAFTERPTERFRNAFRMSAASRKGDHFMAVRRSRLDKMDTNKRAKLRLLTGAQSVAFASVHAYQYRDNKFG